MKNIFFQRKLPKIILIISIFFQIVYMTCGPGCMRCNSSTNECLFCDFEHFYFFDSDSQICKKQKLSNCEVAFSPNNCLLCKNNTHPDINGSCVGNSSTKRIDNCQLFYAGQNCALCKPGHYFDELLSKCIQVIDLIQDCSVYSNKKCIVCKSGFILTSSFNCKSRPILNLN